MVASPIQDAFNVSSDIPYGISLQLAWLYAPVANSAVVIAGLSSVPPEEHSRVIRDVITHKRGQFRIHWMESKKVYYRTRIR